MTREEIIDGLETYTIGRLNKDRVHITVEELQKFIDAIKTLEQEPCDDEYIKVPKKALKYRTAGMVAYNVEWLKNHFDIERVVICGAQEPCGDLISRQAVLDLTWEEPSYTDALNVLTEIRDKIKALPPVNLQEPKTGHWEWVQYDYNPKLGNWHCSECHCIVIEGVYKNEKAGIPLYKYCPQCGVKIGVIEE